MSTAGFCSRARAVEMAIANTIQWRLRMEMMAFVA
jgi:hypothetical protein